MEKLHSICCNLFSRYLRHSKVKALVPSLLCLLEEFLIHHLGKISLHHLKTVEVEFLLKYHNAYTAGCHVHLDNQRND